ncbi:hypothetical protein AMJ44_09055 [candidate division WOR-1 bacterium DG_54_3]|uniref:Uncharacterized protein n=1 Tax=candidate division WOR-1 bacterium DG_54_3 TaxID=1703775 RepID=A0A0S7XUC0_UNCSA|nr:MAG: hypothetical protein AMJ44_09055 [candidate division WOR-1 bacterium DG_54_3]
MRQGVWDEFIVKNQTVDSFMEIYEKVLEKNEFQFKDKKQDGDVLRHKAIWGEGKKAFKRSILPGGALTEKGNRYAAEAEVTQKGNDVNFKILMVPYMSLHDRPDIFLLTQGPMERHMDDEYCKDKLLNIVLQLRDNNLEMISQT